MKTLYMTDLDGTLLDNTASLNSNAVECLNSLIEQGLNFTYATARSWTSASKITKNLNLNLPVVTYNGAFIVNHSSGDIIRAFTLQNEKFTQMLSVIMELNLSPIVYTLIDNVQRVMWAKNHETQAIRNYKKLRLGDKRFMAVGSLQELNQGEVFYITIIGTQKELAPLADIVKANTQYSSVYSKDIYSGDYWLEIYDNRASKASGLEWMRNNYGITKTICFGDNLNDLPMFKAADESYAVRNAVQALKLAANGIIDSNEESGVVEFIRAHFIKGEIANA